VTAKVARASTALPHSGARAQRLRRLLPWLGSLMLTAWYAWAYGPLPLLGDGLMYRRAAVTWMAGGDPWAPARFGFTGLPPTVLAFVPLALAPEPIAGAVLLGLSLAAAVYVVRRLRLPAWVLVSPPVVIGLWVANPHMIVMALLVAGRPWASALSAAVKVYTLPAMVGERRWREVALTVVVFALSVILAHDLWTRYLGEAGAVSARLIMDTEGGGFSAFGRPAMVPTLAALAVLAAIDWRAAGWLAVPALWPGTQVYCATFLLPVSLPLYVASSTPVFGAVPVAVTAYVLWRVIDRVRSRIPFG
jgi:hypothetical protein